MSEENKDDDLLDYNDEENDDAAETTTAEAGDKKTAAHQSMTTSGFRDFLLKPELMKAIQDCGFEHPSQVQESCIPQAIQQTDVICQAKSGMGKTAVFVLATLQQLEPVDGEVHIMVMCHTRELAIQIKKEFERFTKYLTGVKTSGFFGGTPITAHIKEIKETQPHIVVGTPGRIKDLVIRRKELKLDNLKHFVLDECDKMLEVTDMRRDVQEIFIQTPHEKQVMMFSATLSKEIRVVCKKFMQNPMEIYVDDDTKLTLDGLRQYYCDLEESAKTRKLMDLLDAIDFNQVCIFTKSVQRCKTLTQVLNKQQFPTVAIFGGLKQEERTKRFEDFKSFKSRILCSTDLMGRGIDVERVNIVINYDMPEAGEAGNQGASDSYLHRVARAGRFNTKGLAISFVSSDPDREVLNAVQERFTVEIDALPDDIEDNAEFASTYKADE